MQSQTTEKLRNGMVGFDVWPSERAIECLFGGQVDALAVVSQSSDQLARAGQAMAGAISAGKVVAYVAAGSSALMALADAVELPGTFGINPSQIRIMMAGGIPTNAMMLGSVEDDEQAARQAAVEIVKGDVVIVLSVSGNTPYALTIAKIAQKARAVVIGIANRKDAELLALADIPICLETPSEVIAGSTRMGAGTAQKVALNIMSTMMGVHLGHVHDGMMVNVVADNIKLIARAKIIVAKIANVDAETASACLKQTGGAVKPAILLALGASNLEHASKLLENSKGHLRPAMERL